MDGILVVVGLIILAIPVAVIYLLVAISSLRKRILALETELVHRSTDPEVSAEQNMAKPGQTPWAVQKKAAVASESQVEETSEPEPKTTEPAAARVVAQRKADLASAAVEPARPKPLQQFGSWLMANWFYAVSAISLALAGLFLVQYGIENDLFPPTARVLAALAFGAALIAGGEWVRRRFGDSRTPARLTSRRCFRGPGLCRCSVGSRRPGCFMT